MGEMLGLGSGTLSAPAARDWIQLALATPVVLWAGWPFFERGWASLSEPQPQHVHADRARRRRRLPLQRGRDAGAGLFPPAFRGHGGAVAVYFEAAAVIDALVLLGQVLELRARERRRRRSRRCSASRPKTARRVDEPTAARRTCRSTQVQVGDRLRVRPGEKVPVDGVVSRARARSTSRWSPASRSRSRRPRAAKVIGGTINRTGSFVMRAGRSAATRCWRRSCRWSPRRSAAARRSSGWPTRWPAGSCRR